MNNDDGGPAFPVTGEDHRAWGISMRDYFAIKVLASWIIAAPTLDAEDESHRDKLSSLAYAQADSMLKERAK